MTDLETALREHFSTEATAVRTDAHLLAGVRTLRAARRRRRLVTAGSAVAVAVVAAAVATPLALRGHHGGATRVTVGPNQAAVPGKPPAGERAVTWAGIQLYVPATWRSVPGEGDTPVCARHDHPGGVVGYESDVPIAAVACAPAAHPVLEQLQLRTTDGPPAVGLTVPPGAACPPSVTTTSTFGEFAGLPASCIGARVRGQLVTTVRVPSLQAVFTLTTNTQARANTILASAHRVSVDENGCTVAAPSHGEVVTVDGTGGPQVTDTPVSGVVCSYAGGRLVMGVTLTAAQLATVTEALNRLPARYTPEQLLAQQAPGARALDRGGLASIRLTDDAGRTQQIIVQGPLPGVTPWVAGATTSTLSQALSSDLSAVLPSGFGAYAFATGTAAQLPPG